jgi:cytochrome b6-f complex iron-sulfur subunit
LEELKMNSLFEQKPLNLREFSYYLLFAIIILFLLLTTFLSLVYALPRNSEGPVRVSVGATADFPAMDRPYAVTTEEAHLFIVRTQTGWLALDRHTPAFRSCLFAWTEANQRFEDPCYGSKFTLDGRLLEGPAAQNLNQYPITEKSGELFVDLKTIIPGEAAIPILDKN